MGRQEKFALEANCGCPVAVVLLFNRCDAEFNPWENCWGRVAGMLQYCGRIDALTGIHHHKPVKA
jgi:hypothetical protein